LHSLWLDLRLTPECGGGFGRSLAFRQRWAEHGLVPGGFVRYLNAQRHRDVATVLRAALTPKVVDACEPALAAEARLAIEALAADARGKLDPLRPCRNSRPQIA